MRILRDCFCTIPAHLQLVMAASAVAYVETACRIVLGRGAESGWLCAAGMGTLALYLLDGVRSADREDAVSQPGRAELCRRHRAGVTVTAMALLFMAGLCVVLSGPSASGALMLAGLCCWDSRTCFRSSRDAALVHDQGPALLKPVLISLAWLLRASSATSRPRCDVGGNPPDGFAAAAAAAPATIWLDHRDRLADARFARPGLCRTITPTAFLRLRCLLFGLPVISLVSPAVSVAQLVMFLLGAVGLLWTPPDRIRSEAGRVWLASAWRFTGFVGACLAVAVSPG